MKKLVFTALSLFILHNLFAQTYHEPVMVPINSNKFSEEAFPLFHKQNNQLFYVLAGDDQNVGGYKGGHDIKSYQESSQGTSQDFSSLNTKNNNAVVGISEQGDTLYLLGSYKNKNPEKGLSISVRKGIKWSNPIPIEIKNFKPKGDNLELNVHPSGEVIVISMKAKNTVGEEDLYISLRESQFVYEEPVHLGTLINSPDGDFAPFLSKDMMSLYFSSSRLESAGESDIYVSTRTDKYDWESWGPAKKLPSPINTTGYDSYFSLDPDEKRYFVTSTRNTDALRIYSGKFEPKQDPTKQDSVLPIDTVTVDSALIAVNDSTNAIDDTPVDQDSLLANTDKVDSAITNTNDVSSKKETLNLKNQKVAEFAFNSWSLTNDYKLGIKELLKNVSRTKTKVVIQGHTDNIGSEAINVVVSKRRAQAVSNYLLTIGFNSQHVFIDPRGELEPIVPNDTAGNRAKNRRVEIEVKPLK